MTVELNKSRFFAHFFYFIFDYFLAISLFCDLIVFMKDFNPNVLNDILRNPCGSVTIEQLPSLARSHPGLVLGVKMGMSNRFTIDAGRAEMVISGRVAGGDYVREVFIPSETYGQLKKILGIV
jgi:hypothetical protein